MSIPDYRIFFRRCAAFFLAGVLAAGSASAQQTEPPSAAPEQAEEAKQEQPQTQPNQSEMDAVIMALCHEITILKKNEEKRMAVREVLVKNADATYNYFDTRVYEMSAVLYALDDQKIFTLAFYCKAATRLVEMYYAQKPDFQEQEERLSKEIERIKKLAESLELLTEKERRVIELYYYEDMTLKEISKILEVSESRISQLHTKALNKMRKKMGVYMNILTE